MLGYDDVKHLFRAGILYMLAWSSVYVSKEVARAV